MEKTKFTPVYEDGLSTLEKMLLNPESRERGSQFITDLKFAINLIKQHRAKQTELFEQALSAAK